MSGYQLSPAADADLDEIWQYVAENSSDSVANRIEGELHAAMHRLAEIPGMGHLREDLADEPLRFFAVHKLLIISEEPTLSSSLGLSLIITSANNLSPIHLVPTLHPDIRMNNPSKYRTVPDQLVDLGERVRLRLLRILELEELSVGEAASVVQLPQSTVSRHLKVLADGGWIVKRAEGTATLYKLIVGELSTGMGVLWETIRGQLECEGVDAASGQSRPQKNPDRQGAGHSSSSNSPLAYARGSLRNGHRTLPTDLAEDTRRLAGVITDRRTDSQAFFGRVAGQWDDLRTDLFGDRFTLNGLLTLLPREWTVADLGCGTGNASELLAPLVKQVYAIDQSAPMLAAAKKRLHGHTNISFLRGDMHGIPLENASVDATVTVLVLHHIERPLEACREIRRVLRPGGTCLIIDMIEHDRSIYKHTMGHRWLGFTEEKIGGLLIEAGFEKPRFNVLSPDPGARGPGLFACTAYAAG